MITPLSEYWKKEIPIKEGWYWIRFEYHNGIAVRPAQLFIFKNKELGSILNCDHGTWRTYGNDPAFKCFDQNDKMIIDDSLCFGEMLTPPEA